MSASFVSLDGATAIGAGEYRQLPIATAHYTLAVMLTGEPVNCTVVLEGSHDGYAWYPIGTLQMALTGGIMTTPPTAHLFNWIRANMTNLEGGTDPKVTASIAYAVGV